MSAPRFPALYQAAPAAPSVRFLRWAAGFLLKVAAGLALVVAVPSGLWPPDLPAWAPTALAVLGGMALVSLVESVGVAVSGRFLPDLVAGTRRVRVDTGGAPGARAFASVLGMGVLGALSLGVVPLVSSLAGRDDDGRLWHDRWTGTAVVNLRGGRDPLAQPVRAAEIEAAFAPRPEPLPAVVMVNPGRPSVTRTPLPTTPRTSLAGDATRIAGPVAEPVATATVAARILRFDTGSRAALVGSLIIGRRPGVHARFPGAGLVAIDDPSRTVSAIHLAVIANDLGIWVEDLGSTNGSQVVGATGRVTALRAGVRTPVPPGAVVRLGDRTMRVDTA